MSVMYKAMPKGQPGVLGGGEIKYYATIVRERPVPIRKIASEISNFSSLSTTDIFAVLESFLDRMHAYLEEGRSVKMGELGTFSAAITSHGEIEATDVDQASIKKLKVHFRPSLELKSRLSKVKFEKHADPVA